MVDNAEETVWIHRFEKRRASVQAVRNTFEYKVCSVIGFEAQEPDPSDRSISKRSWEKLIIHWRRLLRDCVLCYASVLITCERQ